MRPEPKFKIGDKVFVPGEQSGIVYTVVNQLFYPMRGQYYALNDKYGAATKTVLPECELRKFED